MPMKIAKDQTLGENNQDQPLFGDMLFSFPIFLIVCILFVYKTVGKSVEFEEEHDYVKNRRITASENGKIDQL